MSAESKNTWCSWLKCFQGWHYSFCILRYKKRIFIEFIRNFLGLEFLFFYPFLHKIFLTFKEQTWNSNFNLFLSIYSQLCLTSYVLHSTDHVLKKSILLSTKAFLFSRFNRSLRDRRTIKSEIKRVFHFYSRPFFLISVFAAVKKFCVKDLHTVWDHVIRMKEKNIFSCCPFKNSS